MVMNVFAALLGKQASEVGNHFSSIFLMFADDGFGVSRLSP